MLPPYGLAAAFGNTGETIERIFGLRPTDKIFAHEAAKEGGQADLETPRLLGQLLILPFLQGNLGTVHNISQLITSCCL
jgi:hypothetical protein